MSEATRYRKHYFFCFAFLVVRVSAIPFSEVARLVPKTVTHIAVDEDAGQYLTFKGDGTLHGIYPIENSTAAQSERRAAGTCTPLSVDDAKSLPGWDAIENHANQQWGSGSRNIVTNPPEYLDRPAHVCVGSDPIPVQMTGHPTCQSRNVEGDGNVAGTSGTVELSVTQGFSSESSFTKVSTIGVSNTVSVQLGFEGVADVSDAFTVSTEITNEDTKTFSASYNDESTQKISYEAPESQKCHAVMNVKMCTLQVEGKVLYTAEGWVWFNYDSSTKGYYKWAVNTEAVVTNVEDHSRFDDI